jgi:hypothetical protein
MNVTPDGVKIRLPGYYQQNSMVFLFLYIMGNK